MKRMLALLLAFACAFSCLPGAVRAEETQGELPQLQIDVQYDNYTDDGQADARITVYYFRGSGAYAQSRMENLRVTLQCKNGLEADQSEFLLGSPATFQQVYAHLTYKDPGAAYHPEKNKEERPILEVRATTLNCGEAEYKCYFDARSKPRLFTLYHNQGVSLPDDILNSAGIVATDFLSYSYQYYTSIGGEIYDNKDIFASLDKVGNKGIDDNDITYIYICCHGRAVDGEPTGEVLMMPYTEDSYPRIEDILKTIKETVPGRVVVMLDCCYSGQIIESAYLSGLDSERFFIASATTSFLRSASSGGYMGLTKSKTGFSALLHSVCKKDKAYITCNDLVKRATGFVQGMTILWQTFSNLSINLIAESIDYYIDHFTLLPLVERLNDDYNFSVADYLQHPFNFTLPRFYGNTNLPLIVKDETYDDGYHKLVVYEKDSKSFAPRYVTTQVLDEDTGEEIPKARITIYDDDGFTLQDQADDRGRWGRVLTDKTVRLLFTEEEHEDTWKLLGNDKTIAELVEGIEDPMQATELAAGVETSDIFFTLMKGSVAKFYIYLRDKVVPQIGLVGGDPVPAKAYQQAASMINGASGLVSAAVCDLNGDGKTEMITVTAGRVAAGYDHYGYQLSLYGLSPETGKVELWDTSNDVARLVSDSGSGTLTVHIQRSEGAVYILCFAHSENYTSSEWDYTTTRIYRVEGKKIVDITDYEGFIRGNSGVSLFSPKNSRTVLCYAALEWTKGQTADSTHLAEYLKDVDKARRYAPVTVDLADYAQSKGIERALVDQLIGEIESSVCTVIHRHTSGAGGGLTEYNYSTALDCGLYITARDSDGAILSVRISDDAHYDRKKYLSNIQQYLDTDMSDQLKLLLACALRSEALSLSAGERAGLAAVPLIGNEKRDLDQINFYNKRTETVGSAVLEVEKIVYTAAAGGNASYVQLTMGAAEGKKTEATPEPTPVQATKKPTAAPATKKPTAVPAAEKPTDVPATEKPTAVPAAEEPTAAPATEEPTAVPVTPEPAAALNFTVGRFNREQMLAVYAAPSTKAWRGAKGKAKVSTNDTVWVAGYTGKWLLVMYETSGGSVRIGYIDSDQLKGAPPAAGALQLEETPVKLAKAASLTDDPMKSASIIKKLKKGAGVTLLARWNGWAYVETKVDGQTARGFIPLDSIAD